MALVINDRVKETTTTSGTNPFTLAGAVTGFETFGAGVGNSNTTYYAVTLPNTSEFEVGLGTLNSDSTTLTRTTVISSSNSDNAVSFSSGTKTIFCTIPASKSVFLDASGNATLGADLSVGDDLTVQGGLIDLRSNSGSASQIKFYCEVSNAHAQTLTAQPHSVAASNTLTLPAGGNSTLVSESATQTLTNKTIDASQLSGTVANARLDTELQALAGLTSAADKGIQFTGSGTAATYDLTAAGKALLDDADAAAQRTTLGLGTAAVTDTGISNGNTLVADSTVSDNDFLRINGTSVEGRSATEVVTDIGAITADSTTTLTNKTIDASQLSGTVANARLDAELQALAGLTSASDKGIQFTGSGTAATYDLTTAGKALLDDADAAAQRTTLGLGTAAVAATGISNTNVPVFTSGVADNDFLRVDGTSIEGRSASEVLSDIGGQASLTFGISNTNAVKIDSASVADDEYARFTANGLESRSNSEVLSDIGAVSAADASNDATALAIALG